MTAYNESQMAVAGSNTNSAPVQMYYDGVSMDAIWGMKSLGFRSPQRTGSLTLTKKRYPDL